MLDLLLKPEGRLGDPGGGWEVKDFKLVRGLLYFFKVCRMPLESSPVLVLALHVHLGSWLPVHGNPRQLGQTGPPKTQVHLITNVGQPQGHLVSAGRHREVWWGCAEGPYHPPTQPKSCGTQGPERGGSGILGASSKPWCPSHP